MADVRSKIVDRIRKLLALAKSSNTHEASNAAAHAAKLMAQHQIDSVEDVESEADPVGDNREDAVEITKGKRAIGWKWNLAWVVAQNGGCKPYALHRKVGDQILSTLVGFIGRRSDAQLCAYVYRYLMRDLKRLHDEKRPKSGSRIQQYVPGVVPPIVDRDYQRRWARDFYAGALSVIHDRMAAARASVIPTARPGDPMHPEWTPPGNSSVSSTALARIDHIASEVEAAASDMGLQYVKAREIQVRSERGFAAGVMVGREINLSSDHQGIGEVVPQLPHGIKKP